MMMMMILQLLRVHIRSLIDCLAYKHNATKFHNLNGETEAQIFVPMYKKTEISDIRVIQEDGLMSLTLTVCSFCVQMRHDDDRK
jgi:hypothetical protein